MNFSKETGRFLAKVQNAIDEGVKFSFKAISHYSKKYSRNQEESSKPVKAISKVFKGIGEIGESYYEEYESLKNKKES